MPEFVWEGKTRSGDVRTGEVKAQSVEEVNQILRSSQINPTRVKRKAREINIKLPGSSKAPGKNLVIFTRQFATMIDAGMPLVQCLELLGNAEPHAGFKASIAEVRADIEGGMSLADSMAKHPKTFTPLYTSLIAAGEVAGILDTVMSRLAGQLEKSAKLKRKVKGAFTYPTIVLVISIAVVIILLYKVIPTFSKMFEEMTQGSGAARADGRGRRDLGVRAVEHPLYPRRLRAALRARQLP